MTMHSGRRVGGGASRGRAPVKLVVAAAFFGAVAAHPGCGDPDPNTCVVRQVVPLPVTPLTVTKNARLIPAAGGFVLVAVDGDVVRWAALDTKGNLGTEFMLTLPSNRIAGPWLAVGGKASPADQLMAIYLAPKAGAADKNDLQVIAQQRGAAPTAPVVISSLPTAIDTSVVRVAAGSSRGGLRVAVALGFEGATGKGAPISIFLLGPDGAVVGTQSVSDTPDDWSCLAFGVGKTNLTLSLLAKGATVDKTDWRIFDMDDGGGIPLNYTVHLNAKEPQCPVFAPTPRGYTMAWQTIEGTFFLDFDGRSSPGTVNQAFLAGAVRFGGPTLQPPLAAVAPSTTVADNFNFAIAFDLATAPQMWTFDYKGNIRDQLLLPLTGGAMADTMSAVPGPDHIFATYLDQAAARPDGAAPLPVPDGGTPSSAGVRQFVQVSCAAP